MCPHCLGMNDGSARWGESSFSISRTIPEESSESQPFTFTTSGTGDRDNDDE